MELDFRLALDILPDAVVASDSRGAIVYINRAAEALLDWPAGELVGRPLTAIIPARLHGIHSAGFQHYVSTRRPKLIGHPVRVPALRRDGGELEIELTLSTFQLDGQELLLGVLRDIRFRIELERQITITRYLRAANAAAAALTSRLDLEHVLRTVVDTLVAEFDAALARIWLYDAATNTLHLRASAGLSRETTTSSRARIDLARYPYKVGEVARTRRPFIRNGLEGDPQFDQEWVKREGIASVAAFPLMIAGELRAVWVYFSRQKLPEEVVEVLTTFGAIVATCLNDVQLYMREQEARIEAQEADRQKDEFLALLGHELRTPLSAMASTLQLFQARAAGDRKFARQKERIDRQVSRMARLIDDLQDVARIGRGRLSLHREPLDLGRVIRENVEDLRGACEQAELRLVVELPEEPVLVRGDPTRLAQVFVNLVQNAVKFTDAGGEIRVRLQPDDDWAMATVRDTGIGIDAELLPRIFDRFTQAERSLERTRGGLGMGLALVKGLVALHGGDVSVTSGGAGQGAEFTVKLPLQRIPPP